MNKIKEWSLLANRTIDNAKLSKDSSQIDLKTSDKVYIQSDEEIDNSSKRYVDASDYAKTCGCSSTLYLSRAINCCRLATRTPSKVLNDTYKAFDPVTGYYSINVSSQDSGIQPVINLKINEDTIPFFRQNILHQKNNESDLYTLRFGKYPQSKVRSELGELLEYNYENNLLNSAHLWFAGAYNFNQQIDKNEAFEFKGDIYVRAKPKLDINNRMIKYSNGTIINHKDNADSYVWHKVEPIEWEILNWDNLPTSINPNGTGRDNTIELRTTSAIISGIPFYPKYDKYDDATNTSYYQNSLIRAFLNGYNLQYEIDHRNNGSIEVMSNHNFNQMYADFISTAFNNQIELEKQPMSEVIHHIKSKKNKVQIIDSPMSIDEQIKFYIDNGLPFMLHGKSGIGKSRRVADIDPDYFLLTLRNGMMPEEILGKECPNPSGTGTKWYAPSWYNELCEKCKEEPNKNHILFIDELTNVNEYEQSLVYHIVLNHSLGVTSGKLPENCVVVAAGNSKDESNSAYNMSEPLFRRFHGHIYLPLDLESLLEWGSEPRKENIEQTNLHPLISRFLATYPKTLYSEYDPDKTGKNFAIDPRAWEQISDIIYHNDNSISRELLINKIGESNTTTLIEFAKKDFITIDEIMDDSYDSHSIPNRLDEQYALALQLKQADESQIKKVREFIADHLSGETLAKFDYVWVGKNAERAMIINDLQMQYATKSAEEDINPIAKSNKRKPRAIPLSKFIGSDADWSNEYRKDKMAIHCNSEEKAKLLCKALGHAGCHWAFDGTRCDPSETHYSGSDTCYTNNGRTYTYHNMLRKNIVVYDMRYIDMSEYLSDEDLDRLDDIIQQDGYKRVKITDFVGSHDLWKKATRPDKAYIHCKNEYYAEILIKAFSRMGLKWIDGQEFTTSHFNRYGDKTCYSNNGQYTNTTDPCIPTYDFAEVDFSGIFTTKEIEDIDEIIEKNGDYDKYKMTYTVADVDEYFNSIQRLSYNNNQDLPF